MCCLISFLNVIPARNVSIAVFFLIWSSCLLLIIRIYRDPMMMLITLWAYNCVTLLRMACIGLISLNPPAGLIPLADPITNQFYGAHYITHDLFFSGHTTTVFLIFLCLKKKMGPDLCIVGIHLSGIFFTGSACTLHGRCFGSTGFYLCCLSACPAIYKKGKQPACYRDVQRFKELLIWIPRGSFRRLDRSGN